MRKLLFCFIFIFNLSSLFATPSDGNGFWSTDNFIDDEVSNAANVLAVFDFNSAGIKDVINVGFTSDSLESFTLETSVTPLKVLYLKDDDGDGVASSVDMKFYYQIVSTTPLKISVDASGPMVLYDEDGNPIDYLAWDITDTEQPTTIFSSLNISDDPDENINAKELEINHNPSTDSIGLAGYAITEIRTSEDEGKTYLDKTPGTYYSYIYLEVIANE